MTKRDGQHVHSELVQWLTQAFGGGGTEFVPPTFFGANNVVFGTNPPFSLQDFIALYPKFGGAPATFAASNINEGPFQINVPSTTGLAVGQPVMLAGFPDGTTIAAIVNATTLNLSQPAQSQTLGSISLTATLAAGIMGYALNGVNLSCTFSIPVNPTPDEVVDGESFELLNSSVTDLIINGVASSDFLVFYNLSGGGAIAAFVSDIVDDFSLDGAQLYSGDEATPTMLAGTFTLGQFSAPGATGTLTVWNQPPIPFVVVQAYLALALASLVQARWLDTWTLGIGLFVAHFLTLYAKSDGNPASTVGQIAAQGIATGTQVAKAVGDVSVSYQPVPDLDIWAAWNLTTYGKSLATFAKFIGTGPMLLY